MTAEETYICFMFPQLVYILLLHPLPIFIVGKNIVFTMKYHEWDNII